MRDLTSEVVPASGLQPGQVAELYGLYSDHYLGTDPLRFRTDLAEKDWVILLRDPEGRIAGFSTQLLLREPAAGAYALFSGDTLIRRDCWGTQELVRAWCRLAGSLKARLGEEPLYWFLISKGHRTYLYLPLFFHRFWPRFDQPTPDRERALMDCLAAGRYREAYSPDTGLIRFTGEHDRLRPELDAAPERSDNPHVRYFLERNPAYAEGAELVCLAEISPENMRGAARRELLAGMSAPVLAAA